MAGETTRRTLITSCERIVTGDLDRPIADGDSILIGDGRIEAIGNRSVLAPRDVTHTIDAHGQIAIPGLIDTHIHPSWGDWTGRMNAQGWIAAYGQAGVTTAISQGAFNVDGYPSDPVGMVALGISLARAFPPTWRAGGVKTIAATVGLVEGLSEEDFATLAGEGVQLISEIGVKSIADPPTVRGMLEVAHRHGFTSRVHIGPASVAGSTSVNAQMAAGMGAQIAAHVNGGPTAPTIEDVDFLFERTAYLLELNYSGNVAVLLHVARRARDNGALDRLMVGTDTPSGGGITPRAMLRTCSWLASLLEIPPEHAIAVATGNAARAYDLNRGILEPGREADILLIDAPRDSTGRDGLDSFRVGDIPAVSLLMVDGAVVSLQPRNTPPAKRPVTVSAA